MDELEKEKPINYIFDNIDVNPRKEILGYLGYHSLSGWGRFFFTEDKINFLKNVDRFFEVMRERNIDIHSMNEAMEIANEVFNDPWIALSTYSFQHDIVRYTDLFSAVNQVLIENNLFPLFDVENLPNCADVYMFMTYDRDKKELDHLFGVDQGLAYHRYSNNFLKLFNNKENKWIAARLIDLPVVNFFNVNPRDIYDDKFMDDKPLKNGSFISAYDPTSYRPDLPDNSYYTNNHSDKKIFLTVEQRFQLINEICIEEGIEPLFPHLDNIEECQAIRKELIRPRLI